MINRLYNYDDIYNLYINSFCILIYSHDMIFDSKGRGGWAPSNGSQGAEVPALALAGQASASH